MSKTIKDLKEVKANSFTRAINILRVAANVADTETVTIGADVYEFDRAANGVVAGRIAVTTHADDTPAAATDALIAKINTNTIGTEKITAVDISANEILIYSDVEGAVVTACTETMAGASNEWAAAAMFGGSAPEYKKHLTVKRTPTATEVALQTMHFVFPFNPAAAIAQIQTSAGVVRAYDGDVKCVSNRVSVNSVGIVDIAASDVVVVTASA